VLELLTGALARRNPEGYAAHFRRLDAPAQAAYLARLPDEALADHARALGTGSTLGLTLSLEAEVVLESAVIGKRLPPARGWEAVLEAEARARALAATLGPPTVTGLLATSLEALEASAAQLRAAGWCPQAVTLIEDRDAEGLAEWALAGELARGGRFWTTRQVLAGPAAPPQLAARLERVAAACGARFSRLCP
jgi:hypothetical protein